MVNESATPTPTHSDASAAAEPTAWLVSCAYCFRAFVPSGRQRKRQRFCQQVCRTEYHAARIGQGIRGVVSSVRIMKRGSVSVVLRFGLDERDRALKLEPGKVVGVEPA